MYLMESGLSWHSKLRKTSGFFLAFCWTLSPMHMHAAESSGVIPHAGGAVAFSAENIGSAADLVNSGSSVANIATTDESAIDVISDMQMAPKSGRDLTLDHDDSDCSDSDDEDNDHYGRLLEEQLPKPRSLTWSWTRPPTTKYPSRSPTPKPTCRKKTKSPTLATKNPTVPTKNPTVPTNSPTAPTKNPTVPTNSPTVPTNSPTVPTNSPTVPTNSPTVPTNSPTVPTNSPTVPTNSPTTPTKNPTVPTNSPTVPTNSPTVPTNSPTVPTNSPTVPTNSPTVPTNSPTVPTNSPTVPTNSPTVPTNSPTVPTNSPTVSTNSPTVSTNSPTIPTNSPTAPTKNPTVPTNSPTAPTKNPTVPTNSPTVPTKSPTAPTQSPTSGGGLPPSGAPTQACNPLAPQAVCQQLVTNPTECNQRATIDPFNNPCIFIRKGDPNKKKPPLKAKVTARCQPKEGDQFIGLAAPREVPACKLQAKFLTSKLSCPIKVNKKVMSLGCEEMKGRNGGCRRACGKIACTQLSGIDQNGKPVQGSERGVSGCTSQNYGSPDNENRCIALQDPIFLGELNQADQAFLSYLSGTPTANKARGGFAPTYRPDNENFHCDYFSNCPAKFLDGGAEGVDYFVGTINCPAGKCGFSFLAHTGRDKAIGFGTAYASVFHQGQQQNPEAVYQFTGEQTCPEGCCRFSRPFWGIVGNGKHDLWIHIPAGGTAYISQPYMFSAWMLPAGRRMLAEQGHDEFAAEDQHVANEEEDLELVIDEPTYEPGEEPVYDEDQEEDDYYQEDDEDVLEATHYLRGSN